MRKILTLAATLAVYAGFAQKISTAQEGMHQAQGVQVQAAEQMPEKYSAATKPLLEGIVLDSNFKPGIDFFKRLYTETSSALLYNTDTFEVIEEVALEKQNFESTKEQRRMLKERENQLERKLKLPGKIRFAVGQRDKLEKNLFMIGPWLGHMKREMLENGITSGALAIPALESSLEPNAVSEAHAVGIGQFIRETGRQFMMINSSVDERLDPVYETRATARLIGANVSRYGIEALAVSAYHTGKGNVDRAAIFTRHALQESDADDTKFFSTLLNLFPFQNNSIRGTFKWRSRNYVLSYLGVKQGLEENFKQLMDLEEYEFDTVTLHYTGKQKVTIPEILKATDISEEALRTLNPGLLYLRKRESGGAAFLRGFMSRTAINSISQTIPAGYGLRLPAGTAPEFITAFSEKTSAIEVKAHRLGSPAELIAYNTPADELYGKIIARRRAGDSASVKVEELEEVRDAYLRIKEGEPENEKLQKWIKSRLAVVEYDIGQHVSESAGKHNYFTTLFAYAGRLKGLRVNLPK